MKGKQRAQMGKRAGAIVVRLRGAKTTAVHPLGVKSKILKALRSWATRSLAVGALATALDVLTGLLALQRGLSARMAAMVGVFLGALFTFVGNRLFAFREKQPQWLRPFLRFILVTSVAMLFHGQLVVWLYEGFRIPFVVSKVLADLLVFTFGQLLLFRFVVFPSKPKVNEVEPMASSNES